MKQSGQATKTRRSVLIVEDDRDQLAAYVAMAGDAGLDASGASSLGIALEMLRRRSFTYVLTDIHLGHDLQQNSFEGLEILQHIQANMPEVVAVAMTSDPKIDTYKRVMAAGVSHLFRKPIRTADELLLYLEFAQSDRFKRGALRKDRRHKRELPPHLADRCPDGVVMPPEVRELARLVAIHSDAPLVISGETGTGKEELAKLVHQLACELRGPIPMVAVNCATLVGDTAVSTLFGHKKGAFTGAEATVQGVIGEADGGILFLDEISTLSLECQQRLLRVLNDGSYQRLGDAQTLYSSFQVIAATNVDLYEQVDKGKFLLDLASRLTGLAVTLKPLRERQDDLPLLVELALAKNGVEVERNVLDRLVERCAEFHWRGNIRELFQVVRAMVILAGGNRSLINADHLPVLPGMLAPGQTVSALRKSPTSTGLSREVQAFVERALSEDRPLDETVDEFERLVIRAAVERHSSAGRAANALGVSRSTLNGKRKKLGLMAEA